MEIVGNIAVWMGCVVLLALTGIIAVGVWTGRVRTQGLFEGSSASGARFVSAARVQLFLVTFALAAYYVAQVGARARRLPDVPWEWLVLLACSHALYLGIKLHGKRSGSFHI